MTNSFINGTAPQLAEGIAGCLLNGLVAPSPTESGNETIEHWIAILTQLAEEQERNHRGARDLAAKRETIGDDSSREMRAPLQKLEAGPWRSLGGYFDYGMWPERDRFLELDRAIAAGQDLRDGVGHDSEMI